MDVYHKVLVKLFEATGGKDSQTVDFKDLVKKEGFLGNYNDIFQLLSGKGWIAETPRADVVKITHWGVKEARKAQGDLPASSQEAKKIAAKTISETREFLILLEEFAAAPTKENFAGAEKKFAVINQAINALKENI